MVKKILNDFKSAKDANIPPKQKIPAFITLSKLTIKSILFSKQNSEVKASFFDFIMYGYDYRALHFLFSEVFLLNEYHFKPKTDDPVIIDCGSNIGMSVLYFKQHFPNCSILSFEANPYAFKLLEKNIKANKLQSVEAKNVALYNEQTEISFFIGKDVGTVRGSIKSERGGQNEMKIKAERLSDYLKKFETVDLIKMDVEGAEWKIVDDLIATNLLGKPQSYIIEYHHNIDNDTATLSAFLKKFEDNGFKYNIKTDFPEINSFQDILIYFYKN